MVLGWNIFPEVAAVVVALSATGSLLSLLQGERRRGLAIGLASAAVAVFALFIAAFWITLSRPPLRTMGETRLWYSFFLLVAGLATYVRWRYRWIMSFSTVMATLFMLICILKPELHDHTLMPALQSVWFVPHVSVYIFSYSLLGCALLLSLYAFWRPSDEIGEAIDRTVRVGVSLFTFGMLSGALWAKEAWGAYWSWDAKESWALATWGLYLLAIHLGWRRRRLFLATVVVAFLSLQMCWWGVNYLPSAKSSDHTYTLQTSESAKNENVKP